MKRHSIFKMVLITILVLVLCTWLLPVTNFSYTELVEGERSQLGLFDLFSYPLVAFSYFGNLFLYVLLCGAFYGVLNKIPAYKAMLEKIVKGFNGKEWIFLVITMMFISILTSVAGFSFGFIILFPIIISIVMMMGYNKIVAAIVTVGSVVTGLIGTTVGSNSVTYLNSLLNVSIYDEIFTKIIILIITLILLIFNALNYAMKTKNNINKDDKELIPETIKVNKGKKIIVWPLAIIFDLMIIVMLMGSFSWVDVFNLKIFDDCVSFIQTDLAINKFPIVYKILGNVNPFGRWTFNLEYILLPMLTSGLLALVYLIKFDDFIDGICTGIKKAIKPALFVILAYVMLIICTYHPFQLTIIKPIIELTKGLNIVTMSFVAFLSSLFNVDSIYVANATMPYITSVITDIKLYPLIEIIFQSIYGLASLILPSSVILLVTLSYMDISYGQWLKHIWKFFLEVLVVLLIIFIILLVV